MDYFYVISLPERGYWSGSHWTSDKLRAKLYEGEPAAFTAVQGIPRLRTPHTISIDRVELTQWLTKGAKVWVNQF